MNNRMTVILLCLVLCLNFAIAEGSSIYEIDNIAIVTRVIDGDTFEIDLRDRIRLADIDTPEIGEQGYESAKLYVAALVAGKTVYLDIDDIYRFDTNGDRLVAVTYVNYNTTHYLNLNKALVEYHYAVIWDHDNEFNPDDWVLYTPITPTSTPTSAPKPTQMDLTSTPSPTSPIPTINTGPHTEPFPIETVLVVASILTSVVVVSLLLYVRHLKRSTAKPENSAV